MLKGDKLNATEGQMKAIETLQSTLNNWSDGDWGKELKESIEIEEPVMTGRQSPRVLNEESPQASTHNQGWTSF